MNIGCSAWAVLWWEVAIVGRITERAFCAGSILWPASSLPDEGGRFPDRQAPFSSIAEPAFWTPAAAYDKSAAGSAVN